MSRREFQTRVGQVELEGDFADQRPLVVVIRGAYAGESQLSRLPPFLPEAAVAFGDIPGNRSPRLVDQRMSTYRAGYSEALDQLARPVVVLGASLGGVIALGLQSPSVRGIVALDPPMSGAEVDTIAHFGWKPRSPEEAEFLEANFGQGADHHATPTAATWVLRASHEPLLGDRAAARLAALPNVELAVVPTTHDVAEGGGIYILAALRAALGR